MVILSFSQLLFFQFCRIVVFVKGLVIGINIHPRFSKLQRILFGAI